MRKPSSEINEMFVFHNIVYQSTMHCVCHYTIYDIT